MYLSTESWLRAVLDTLDGVLSLSLLLGSKSGKPIR